MCEHARPGVWMVTSVECEEESELTISDEC